VRTGRQSPVIAVAGALVGLLFPYCAFGQWEKPWQFPSEQRAALESRLRLFTRAQAEGRWSDVALLLGAYRRGLSGYLLYTPAHKSCLVCQMQALPLIDFNFTIRESPFSSEILSTPPGKRWWVLVGEGSFREASGIVKKPASVTVYRDRGDWYFTPAIDDEGWARAHLTAEQLAADYGDRVEQILAPGCPLDIVNLHVSINPKHLSSRLIEFRLRNKTGKRVKGYCFEISDDTHEGSTSVGTGAPQDAIEPNDVSREWEVDHTGLSLLVPRGT